MRRLCVVLLLVLVVPAVATAATVRIGPRTNGKTVTIHKGDTLRVSLAGNPSTGYRWLVAHVDRSVLWLAGTSYTPSPHPPGSYGSGGTYHLGFRAVATGSTVLRLRYAQSFDLKASDPRFRARVVVRP